MSAHTNYNIDFRGLFNTRRFDLTGEIIPVLGILGVKFIIKPYQRGYRWDSSDLKKLISDISKYSKEQKRLMRDIEEFAQVSIDEAEEYIDMKSFDFYCLQTLTAMKDSDNVAYELIDGQQRLTSMLIIYEVLNTIMIKVNFDEKDSIPYRLIYDRSNKTKNDLSDIIHRIIPRDLELDNTTTKIKELHSDYLNLQNEDDRQLLLQEVIHAFSTRLNKNMKNINFKGSMKIDMHYVEAAINTLFESFFQMDKINLSHIWKCICFNTFFIWYELSDNPYNTFVSLNSNQIELTNAELIKSLILRDVDKKEIIAPKRWEDIEQGLSRDELWSFISGEDKSTKIDLLFELYARRDDKYCSYNPSDKWGLFSYYEDRLNKSTDLKQELENIMKGIESIYDRICEWYNDVDIYHYIGLITVCRSMKLIDMNQEELILYLYENYEECNKREEFINNLKQLIKSAIIKDIKEPEDKAEAFIEQLSYDSGGSEQSQRKNIQVLLWLINVIETINASENNLYKTRNNIINTRLPFSRVIRGKWTIEHIMPQNPKEDIEHSAANIAEYNELQKAIEGEGALVFEHEAEKHWMWNLTLLESADNSSVSNSNLEVKRCELINRIGEGSYVPCSTVNVFLLYYNDEQSQMLDYKYWTKHNAQNYNKRIIACLKEIGFGG